MLRACAGARAPDDHGNGTLMIGRPWLGFRGWAFVVGRSWLGVRGRAFVIGFSYVEGKRAFFTRSAAWYLG